MYSEKVMDHFMNPRNVGEIENASGVGTVGNAKCGDIMRMYLDIDDNGIIQDVKFKTFGCGADIVIGSHPHVVQPLEYHIEGKDTTGLTVYSLGNFISNQSKRYTNGGIGISLKLIREHGKTRYQMHYLSNYVYRPIESDGIRRYYVVPEPEATQLLGENDKELYQQFFKDTDKIINQASLKLDVNK